MLTQSAARCRGAAMVLRLFRDGNRLAASSSADDEVDASVTWQHHGLARPLRDDSAFADRARVPTMNMTEAATTRFQIRFATATRSRIMSCGTHGGAGRPVQLSQTTISAGSSNARPAVYA